MTDADAALAPYLARWRLLPDGPAFATPSSVLQPVRRGAEVLFLKRAVSGEEKSGNAVLRWWDGDGCARVIEAEGDTVLFERAVEQETLAALARPVTTRRPACCAAQGSACTRQAARRAPPASST